MPETSIFQQISPRQKVHQLQSGPQSSKFSIHNFLTRHFTKKIYYDLFTELGFSVDYPEWQKSKATTSDLVLSVSNGKFEMEVYVEPAEPYTFASYLRKVGSAIRSQLNAKIIKKNESVDSAYTEFVLIKQNVLWLYKARVVECNKHFYTVSFNGPKKEFYKIDKIAEHVFSSMECYIPENSKSVKFQKALEEPVAEDEFRKMPDIEELSAEEEFEKMKEADESKAVEEKSSEGKADLQQQSQEIPMQKPIEISQSRKSIEEPLQEPSQKPKIQEQKIGVIEINAQKASVPETRYEPKVKIFEERENVQKVEQSKKMKVIEYDEKD